MASMRFLYVVDLHGDLAACEAALKAAVDLGAAAIVNGGDMLPHGSGDALSDQRAALRALGAHLADVRSAGVRAYLMFGNDDARALSPALDEWAADGLAVRLDAGWSALGGWQVIGFPWVPDTPFRLKDWCRHDWSDRRNPPQFGEPLVSTQRGLTPAGGDSGAYLSRLPTIEEELARLPAPGDPDRAILVTHGPPAGIGLDLCWDGRAVGSVAGKHFIEASGFPLSLHGHIHEAPQVSGAWHARLGRTTCVNPGVRERPDWVLVDLDARTLRHRWLGDTVF